MVDFDRNKFCGHGREMFCMQTNSVKEIVINPQLRAERQENIITFI